MERILIFVAGCLLLLPFFVCLISNSLALIVLGTIYLAIILKFIPKKFWRRLIWTSARFSKILEGGK